MCYSNSSDGTLFIGGLFTSISGTSAANIASYSLSSGSFRSLSSGVSREVETLYCDDSRGQVWIGGDFDAMGENLALWSTSSSAWETIPFRGFNGPVRSIEPNANGSSLIFGGQFTTAFASNTSSQSIVNGTTSGNITSIPSAPDGTITTGNSGYLTPVRVPFSANQDPNVQIKITGSPSSSQPNFADPNVMICPGEPMWLARDNSPAKVTVVGINWMRASGIRMANALVQGRGTKTFS
jgi:hypothetical protein